MICLFPKTSPAPYANSPLLPVRNMAERPRAGTRHSLFPSGLQAIQSSVSRKPSCTLRAGSSTPSKLSGACPHPHGSHSG